MEDLANDQFWRERFSQLLLSPTSRLFINKYGISSQITLDIVFQLFAFCYVGESSLSILVRLLLFVLCLCRCKAAQHINRKHNIRSGSSFQKEN